MNNYQKLLHEIEEKKNSLERRIAEAVQAEISQWEKETQLPIKSVYIDMANISSLREPKRYVVSNSIVDIDYKP